MVDFNASNYTNDWFMIWTQPYIHVFGDLFFGLALLVLGAGIYIGSDKNNLMTALYFVACALIFGPIFNLWLTTIILFIPGAIFAGIAYNAFIEKKPRW